MPISAGTYMSVSLSPPVTHSPFHALIQNIGHFPLSISQCSISPQMARRHCLLCCPSEQEKNKQGCPLRRDQKPGPRQGLAWQMPGASGPFGAIQGEPNLAGRWTC